MKRNSAIFARNFELQRCYKSDIAQKPDIERRSLTYKNVVVSLAVQTNKPCAHSLRYNRNTCMPRARGRKETKQHM